MQAALRQATPAAERITTVVNAHANGDHCYGNALVADAEIVASSACAREMTDVPPSVLAAFRTPPPTWASSGLRKCAASAGSPFEGIELVCLVEVGPAHTRRDVIVHLPDRSVVFTGDVVFHGGHPRRVVGPGDELDRGLRPAPAPRRGAHRGTRHGAVADLGVVAALKGYFEHLTGEARRCYDAGLGPREAARAVKLGPYRSWSEPERRAVNVNALYRDFGADVAAEVVRLFTDMAALAQPGH
jgi:cyclase